MVQELIITGELKCLMNVHVFQMINEASYL